MFARGGARSLQSPLFHRSKLRRPYGRAR